MKICKFLICASAALTFTSVASASYLPQFQCVKSIMASNDGYLERFSDTSEGANRRSMGIEILNNFDLAEGNAYVSPHSLPPITIPASSAKDAKPLLVFAKYADQSDVPKSFLVLSERKIYEFDFPKVRPEIVVGPIGGTEEVLSASQFFVFQLEDTDAGIATSFRLRRSGDVPADQPLTQPEFHYYSMYGRDHTERSKKAVVVIQLQEVADKPAAEVEINTQILKSVGERLRHALYNTTAETLLSHAAYMHGNLLQTIEAGGGVNDFGFLTEAEKNYLKDVVELNEISRKNFYRIIDLKNARDEAVRSAGTGARLYNTFALNRVLGAGEIEQIKADHNQQIRSLVQQNLRAKLLFIKKYATVHTSRMRGQMNHISSNCQGIDAKVERYQRPFNEVVATAVAAFNERTNNIRIPGSVSEIVKATNNRVFNFWEYTLD